MIFSGIFNPMATPFRDGDQRLDLDAVRRNVRWFARSRLRGLVVMGSNGEAAYLTSSEADALVAAVRDEWPRDRLLIVGTGHDATLMTIDATRRAATLGADYALVRTPSAFKGQMTGEALVAHYRAVADASPIPILLYNFAASFGVNLPTPAVATLAAHPNIAGMKESGGDIAQISEQVGATPDDFEVVVGSAPTLYASLCVGAVGGVVAVANVMPDAVVRLYDLAQAGRHAEALALQRALTPLARGVTGEFGVAGLKAAMSVAGLTPGVPRSPLRPATDAVRSELEARYAALDAFLAAAVP